MASGATKNAKIAAINNLCGRQAKASERQVRAFEYFLLLRDPSFFVNLLETLPHMRKMIEKSWSNSPLAKKWDLLNPQQKHFYLNIYRRLPCGIAVMVIPEPGKPFLTSSALSWLNLGLFLVRHG